MNTICGKNHIQSELELAEKTEDVSTDSENGKCESDSENGPFHTDNFLIGIDWNDEEEDDVFEQDTVDKKQCAPEVGSYSKGLSMCTCDLEDHGLRLDTHWSDLSSFTLPKPNISVSMLGNLGSYEAISTAESGQTVIWNKDLEENETPFSFKSSLEKRAQAAFRNTEVREAVDMQRRRLHARIARKREAVHSVTHQLEEMLEFEAEDTGNEQHGGQPLYSPLFLYPVHFQEANL